MAVEEEDQRRRKEEEEQEEQSVREENYDGPAHHPSPPPDELFDISTTVDPSYVISLIRKLLPVNAANDCTRPGVDNSGNEWMKNNHMGESVVSQSANEVSGNSNGLQESMDLVDDVSKSNCIEENFEDSHWRQPDRSASEKAWEEYGCILWDLSASRNHAELMVENLILEVLLANLMVTQSVRITEICLGIIGNLACHEVPLKHIVSKSGLVDIIVEQLFLDDAQCLNEVCRILTSGLLGTESSVWAKTLQPEHILRRMLWITENTLNPQLMEKVVGLLLAIIEGQLEVRQVLFPRLMNLGLANLLINLVSFEMGKLMRERTAERYSILDVILQAIEALSVIDGHSEEICSNKELCQVVCELIKLPDKAEVATSCVTAGVLTANILSDRPDLAAEISQDFSFLQGVFDILAFASDDSEAKRAVWDVIARLLVRVHEAEISTLSLDQYVQVLVSKSDLIEDDLLDLKFDESNKENESLDLSQIKSSSRVIAIRKIIGIVNQWNPKKDRLEHNTNDECNPSNGDVVRLLDCCRRYIEFRAE